MKTLQPLHLPHPTTTAGFASASNAAILSDVTFTQKTLLRVGAVHVSPACNIVRGLLTTPLSG
ncbi:hypothetical protein [Burkholderia glumae]|uniref:hypothetical protein n=1 Tax=Burkholderia glumae TaxID=337 RepID=UPI0021509A1E|nr:hypothetical protein [Burkholderia glumae]